MAVQAELVHREKDAVVEHKRQPEVHPAPERTHHPSEHFRIPVRHRRENREQTSAEEHVMQVRDDEIRVVDIDVEG